MAPAKVVQCHSHAAAVLHINVAHKASSHWVIPGHAAPTLEKPLEKMPTSSVQTPQLVQRNKSAMRKCNLTNLRTNSSACNRQKSQLKPKVSTYDSLLVHQLRETPNTLFNQKQCACSWASASRLLHLLWYLCTGLFWMKLTQQWGTHSRSLGGSELEKAPGQLPRQATEISKKSATACNAEEPKQGDWARVWGSHTVALWTRQLMQPGFLCLSRLTISIPSGLRKCPKQALLTHHAAINRR